jgi:hypothetical protein
MSTSSSSDADDRLPERAVAEVLLGKRQDPPKPSLIPESPAPELPASPPAEGQAPGPSTAVSATDGPPNNPLPDPSADDAAQRDPAIVASDDEVVRRVRRHRRSWYKVFLDDIRMTGTVGSGCAAAGVSRGAPYARAKRDPAFAAAWAEAKEDATDLLVVEGRRRALEGSDRLLEFFLRAHRPEVYREGYYLRSDPRRQAQKVADHLRMTADEVLDEADRRIQEERS